jgi:hypothetical protein
MAASPETAATVLVIGLDPFRVPGPWDPRPVAEAVEAAMAELREHGFDAESCSVGLDGSDDIEARVTAALRARPWDCVLVGGGIRKRDDLLTVFEAVVNLARVHAPQAEIVFNQTPRDLLEAVTRRLD